MRLSLGTAIPRRDAVVRIRTADHPINSRGLYRTELRRPARPYKRAAQIVSQPGPEWPFPLLNERTQVAHKPYVSLPARRGHDRIPFPRHPWLGASEREASPRVGRPGPRADRGNPDPRLSGRGP